MNNKKIKTYIKILRKVRIKIENKEHEFICIAVNEVQRISPKLQIECQEINQAIRKKLGVCFTLNDWVMKEYQLNWYLPKDQMIQMRLNWIDATIKSLQGKLI